MMAVMTASQKTDSKGPEVLTKRHIKYSYRTRPITATLEHPIILDIKLLKKLDMTTFTKKGLIALSKFCGISLINKADTKKKFNKCVKTIQYSKKQFGNECNELPSTLITESNKNFRTKRKLAKQFGKTKPRIRFKIGKEETSVDEDSLDVVCKKHTKVLKTCGQNSGKNNKSPPVDTVLSYSIENIIPEPCKTCNRSEHPERFHSHPKMLTRLALQEKSNVKNLEEQFRNVVTTKDTEDGEKEDMRKSPCAKESEGDRLQNSSLTYGQCEKNISEKNNSSKPGSKSPTKSDSFAGLSSPETENQIKSKHFRKPQSTFSSSTKPKTGTLKRPNLEEGLINKVENKITITAEEDVKFITGCYICGKQVSPKLRMQHEKSCILEWRTQNNLASPDKRKPEPKRPDFRFTASGDVDCEGTFDSIWANHIDSLVPCKKCGRKFFPDRIEKHENCCNNVPINVKYKH